MAVKSSVRAPIPASDEQIVLSLDVSIAITYLARGGRARNENVEQEERPLVHARTPSNRHGVSTHTRRLCGLATNFRPEFFAESQSRHATDNPFVRLNVLSVQKAAEFRYQT